MTSRAVASLLWFAASATMSCRGGEGIGGGRATTALEPRQGVDYSFDRPSPTGLHDAGYTFAVRYLSFHDGGKNLSGAEADALQKAGVDVVSNWENDAGEASNGFDAGASNAAEALRQANDAGMPAGRPIYFSVDFDASPGDQGAINSYFEGVASVLGLERVGAYGSYYVIQRLFDAGKIKWGWQTYARSGGQWESRAQLRQVQNDVSIAGGQCDVDLAQAPDFGQWQASGGAVGDCNAAAGLADLALQNIGGTACGTNSLGEQGFASSCTGNGGQPEYWCADFVRWVWASKGVDTSGLTAAAGSFYVYGQNHGTLSNTPSVGAAVVFNYDGNGYADHVAIVTRVNADGTIETASGDWNGESGSQAHFAATAHVVPNTPAFDSTVGSSPGPIGMAISGYISAQGLSCTTPGSGNDCSVQSDQKLHCPNTVGAALHTSPSSSSSVVNHLRTTPSWFDCWGTGELHAGGNTTWYHTLGDDNGNWGWVPAVDLRTPDAFDADPSAHGLARCASSPPPPPPPPPTDPNCSVHADSRLYCTNAGGSAMYAAPSASSTVVDHLRTTSSWFDCWGTGDLHAGGNTTWYHTLGDDYGNWGWVPAVDLNTSSAFDADPSAQGLPKCGG